MERLSQGYSVITSPEGTRSPAGGLHPFGRMAFEIARRQNVPIVPIVPLVITCEPRWLTRENSFSNPPGLLPRMRIRVLEPVDPSVEGSSSRTLRDMISSQIPNGTGKVLFREGSWRVEARASMNMKRSAVDRKRAPAESIAPPAALHYQLAALQPAGGTPKQNPERDAPQVRRPRCKNRLKTV